MNKYVSYRSEIVQKGRTDIQTVTGRYIIIPRHLSVARYKSVKIDVAAVFN